MSEKPIVGDFITVSGTVTKINHCGGLVLTVCAADVEKAVIVKKAMRVGDTIICKFPGNSYDMRTAKVKKIVGDNIICDCTHICGTITEIHAYPQYWHVATSEEIENDAKQIAAFKKAQKDKNFTTALEEMNVEEICEKMKEMTNALVKKGGQRKEAEKIGSEAEKKEKQ